MRSLKEGSIIVVKVKSIKKYGFFVSINEELDGLVHISEISDNYVKSITKFVEVGEVILARVVTYRQGKMNLSIKNMNYKLRKTCVRYLEGDYVVDENFTTIKAKLGLWIKEYERNDEISKR